MLRGRINERRGFGAGIFRKIWVLTSEQKMQCGCIVDNDGTVLTEQKPIVGRMKRNTEKLYNKPDDEQGLERLYVVKKTQNQRSC